VNRLTDKIITVCKISDLKKKKKNIFRVLFETASPIYRLVYSISVQYNSFFLNLI